MALTDEQLTRYARHIALKGFGLKGQKALMAGSVLVVGAGGLGSPAALYLAAAGVGRIGIVDGDVVELSNLQRQIAHTTARLGQPKAESAAQAMRALNPDVKVETHALRLGADNAAQLVGDYDFVIEGTDDLATKYLVNEACVAARAPYAHGGVLRFHGEVMTYVPGEGPCYRCAFGAPPASGSVASCAQAGIIGAVPGVIGSLQAMEAVKYLTGTGELLCGRLLTFDAFYGDFTEIEIFRDPACPVCGTAS